MSYRLGMCGAAAIVLSLGCGGSSNNDGVAGSGGTGASGGTGGSSGSAGSSGWAGSSGTGGTSGSGGTSGAGGSAGASGPEGLAFEKAFLGDTDRTLVSSPTAWKQFGRNIDGLVSTNQSTDVCQPYAGASSAVKADGDGGIDNSFGANLIPIIGALASSPSQTMTDTIQSGQFTVLMDFGDPFSPTDQTNVATGLLSTGQLPAAPKWDGTDVWPISYESTIGGNAATPKAKFTAGTIAGGVWTSEAAGAFTLVLELSGFSLPLELTRVQMSATLSGSGSTLAGNMGTLSGILDTEKLVAELKKVAGGFDPSLCNSATFDSIAAQIRQASDILLDGTQDPSKACDAISLGIGFEAKAARIGPVDAPVTPPPDPCAP